MVRYRVSDTGIGIPADQIDAVFGEFRQVTRPPRATSAPRGLG